MLTKKQYVEYLVSTPKNWTCPSLAAHLEDVSPEGVSDFLHQKRFRPREVGKRLKDRSEESKAAFLLVDDRGQDQRDSRFSDLVGAHDRGQEPRGVRGLGGGRLVQRAGQEADCSPRDSRISAPAGEGQPQNAHFSARVTPALDHNHVPARPRLFAGW